jgi:hypothetical protein
VTRTPECRVTRRLPASMTGQAASALLALSAVLAALSGCTGSTAEPAGYDPVPDEQLFEQVGALPGVRAADLEYKDTFAHPSEYSGDVTVGRGVDPVETLDAVSAILWQGRPEPTVVVTVRGPQGVLLDSTSVNLIGGSDFEDRYGPQPGTGEVPEDAELLPRPPGLP